jgi:L-lactate dehydrogenase
MKIGIIGAGFVGSTAAYAMVLEGTASEIILIDINKRLAAAQAEDILHATPWSHSVKISAGDYPDLQGATAVILACGVSQKEGETRLDLMGRNARVFMEVIPRVIKYAKQAILVVASNPVDVITHLVTNIAHIDPHRVIGSGTILDTARFRTLIADHLKVSPQSVHAYVLGEHGDSEVLTWSGARVGGLPLAEFAEQTGRPIDSRCRETIDTSIRRAAYRIIEGKGSTYYGIGAGLARIIQAIRDDEGAVLTISSRSRGPADIGTVCMSVPRVVRAAGIGAELWPPLSDDEHAALLQSATVLNRAARDLGYE